MGVIFWGDRKLFSRNERGVRLALKHPVLVDRPVIGRGAYSVILAGEKSVFKLTIDKATYGLAERQSQWRCSGLPVILGLHGQVGSTDGGSSLLLIEMEHLQRLGTGTAAARSRCLTLSRELRRYLMQGDVPATRLRKAHTLQPDDGIGQALLLLAEIVESQAPDTELDLHRSNFMWREHSGEAVITDPVMDLQTRDCVRGAFLRKRGLSRRRRYFSREEHKRGPNGITRPTDDSAQNGILARRLATLYRHTDFEPE